MTARHLAAAALLALGAAAPAQAQFTAVVAPPRPRQPEAQVVAQQQAAAQADSSRRTQLSEMRAWVDSAAQAATGRPVVRQDSSAMTAGAGTTSGESAGSVALPDTATPLPLVAAAGLGLLVLGGVLVRRPRRALARRQSQGGR